MKKVLGMGNALVDVMTKLPNDSILKEFNLPKGSMQLVDTDFIQKLTLATEKAEKQIASGGSAANTIHGLAKLGVSSSFIGSLGNDIFGKYFSDDMKNSGAETRIFKGSNESGRAVALVTPDSERTFAVYLGAAIELTAEHLTLELFQGYDYFHIEGYLVQNHDLIRKAVELALQAGCKVSLDMASYNVVEANLDFLKELAAKVHIIFANEEEAKAFTGKEPEDALMDISQLCPVAIVKIGKHGSLIRAENKTWRVGVIDCKPVDTTGAGDLYASGFIYGLIEGCSYEVCGKIGAVLAGNVIEVIGAKMNEKRWETIKSTIHKLIQ